MRPIGLAGRKREGRKGAHSACEEGGRYLGTTQNLGHPARQPVTINSVATESEAEQLFARAGHTARETDEFAPTGFPADRVVELWKVRRA